ncbi:MAG: 1,6-anhydro-N-acetylmuramyl-L-alanine amidase AmpD [Gammaproteobacteria bacterium]|nr:1,6-anhydro-N-acetylmuramyl-L-alanine amidase AmpD [Gammaproteobacteria bacterium]
MNFTLNASGWIENIGHCPSPNYGQRPEGMAVDLLVIHNISLPPGEFGGKYIEDFFQNKLDSTKDPYFKTIKDLKVSAHFLIKRDGDIVQFVSVNDRAWHAGVSSFEGRDNCGDFSIGIELEGTDTIDFNEAQYQSLVKLTQTIMNSFPDITLNKITGHSDIAPGRKTDPGPHFNWNAYRERLKHAL